MICKEGTWPEFERIKGDVQCNQLLSAKRGFFVEFKKGGVKDAREISFCYVPTDLSQRAVNRIHPSPMGPVHVFGGFGPVVSPRKKPVENIRHSSGNPSVSG
jgi:hypothetical protein